MTLKCLPVKITLKYAHLVTLSDEKSGTMLFKALKPRFVENEGDNKVTTQNRRCSLQSRPCYIDRLSIESCTVNCFTADCAFSKLFDKT